MQLFCHILFLRNACVNLRFLIGGCDSIHWHQGNSLITQNQFVDVARVAHAARLDNIQSTNASFARVLFDFSNDEPGVN